jgi:hypothetical protein
MTYSIFLDVQWISMLAALTSVVTWYPLPSKVWVNSLTQHYSCIYWKCHCQWTGNNNAFSASHFHKKEAVQRTVEWPKLCYRIWRDRHGGPNCGTTKQPVQPSIPYSCASRFGRKTLALCQWPTDSILPITKVIWHSNTYWLIRLEER